MLKKFVEHDAVSGVAGWEAPSVSWDVPQGLRKQHYRGFYVGNMKLESAPVPRQWL